MKSLSVKKAIVLTACLFMIPVASFAATKTAAHKDTAVSACAGKAVGDAVTMHKKGKKVAATCQEVNGVLKAVVKMK